VIKIYISHFRGSHGVIARLPNVKQIEVPDGSRPTYLLEIDASKFGMLLLQLCGLHDIMLTNRGTDYYMYIDDKNSKFKTK